MSFTNQEKLNSYSQILQASVVGSPRQAWYESQLLFESAVISDQVFDKEDFNKLKSLAAPNITAARNNALLEPGIISDISQPVNAVRLTPVPGTNGTVYAAFAVYNDFTSERLKLWIQPQMIPQNSGLPSNGYAIRLFNGNPNSGGTEITTTQGTSGTGLNKSVGWIPIASAGILLLSESFASSVTDPWWMGFRYIGRTGSTAQKKQYFENVSSVEVNDVTDLTKVQVFLSIEQNTLFNGILFNYSQFNINSGLDFIKYDGYTSIIYNDFFKNIKIEFPQNFTGYILY